MEHEFVTAMTLWVDAYNLVKVGASDEALKASLDILAEHLKDFPPQDPAWIDIRRMCSEDPPSRFRTRWQ